MAKNVQRPWLFVFTIALGTLINPLNSSMISVALTRLQNVLDLSFANATWLISIFYLASAFGQPLMGKLSDMFGAKRLFLTGLFLVAMSSILAPLFLNFGWLLFCRALQAIGSSALFPTGMAMVRNNITHGQAQALSALSIVASVSAAFGPSIGGFLIQGFDWQAIFLINLPFIILSFTLAIFILPSNGVKKFEFQKIDFIGIGLFVVAMIFLILFLLSIGDTINFWTVPVFIICFYTFYKYERKQAYPFIDVIALLGNINQLFVYVQFLNINIVYYFYFYGLPIYLMEIRNYNEGTAGVFMLAFAGLGVIFSPFAARWIDRAGSKPAVIFGSVALTLGTTLILTINSTSSVAWLLVVMGILGLSNGFNNIGMQMSLFQFIRPEDTGMASGLFQTSRYVGAILSSSLLGIFFNKHIDIEHFHIVALIGIAFCIFTFFLAVRMPRKGHMGQL